MTHISDLNLTARRSTASVWDRRGWDGYDSAPALTRWLVGIGGGALAVQGLRQRSATGAVLAGFGASLAWWALTSNGRLPDVRQWANAAADRAGIRHDDEIAEASEDSFPASDSPAWTLTTGTGLRNSELRR